MVFSLSPPFCPFQGLRTRYRCGPPWYTCAPVSVSGWVCLFKKEKCRGVRMLLCSVGICFQTVCLSSSSVSERTEIWVVPKSNAITRLLMYSSNSDVHINEAFVTFKFLLDMFCWVFCSKSNYAFQLITTDSGLMITFTLYNPKLMRLQWI